MPRFRFETCLASALATLVFASLPVPSAAFAEFVQVTDVIDPTCFMASVSASDDGAVVVFESTCDLTGGNADGNREIFAATFSSSGGPPFPIVVQITDTSTCANANPDVSGDGTSFAYDSDCDPAGGNPDGSVEIFHIAGANDPVQLTTGQFCNSFEPSLNRAGDLVAFDSDCDFVGTNVDRSSEIFQSDSAGNQIVQLTVDDTASGCGSLRASSNAMGDLVAFESDCDLTGENPDEIFEAFQAGAGGSVWQLSFSLDDDCGIAAVSSDGGGDAVAFESDCDYAGANADASVEIFRVDTSTLAAVQVSDDDGSSGCESFDARLSEDGGTVWYTSACDPLGANADGGTEIFVDSGLGAEQLTETAGCENFSPAVAAKLSKVGFFASTCDFVGTNGDFGDEVFRGDLCACGAPVSRYLQQQKPVASDALFALNSAVGLQNCDLCDCDVDGSGGITALDALIILNASIDLPAVLACF